MKVVFPTIENQSYISNLTNFFDANFFTVLGITDGEITSVETKKNKKFTSDKELKKEFKKNKYDAIVVPNLTSFPKETILDLGMKIYANKESNVVWNIYHEYIHNRLDRVY